MSKYLSLATLPRSSNFKSLGLKTRTEAEKYRGVKCEIKIK